MFSAVHELVRTSGESSLFVTTHCRQAIESRVCAVDASECDTIWSRSQEEFFLLVGVEDLSLKIDFSISFPNLFGTDREFSASSRTLSGELVSSNGTVLMRLPPAVSVPVQLPLRSLLQAANVDLDAAEANNNSSLRHTGIFLYVTTSVSNVHDGVLRDEITYQHTVR